MSQFPGSSDDVVIVGGNAAVRQKDAIFEAETRIDPQRHRLAVKRPHGFLEAMQEDRQPDTIVGENAHDRIGKAQRRRDILLEIDLDQDTQAVFHARKLHESVGIGERSKSGFDTDALGGHERDDIAGIVFAEIDRHIIGQHRPITHLVEASDFVGSDTLAGGNADRHAWHFHPDRRQSGGNMIPSERLDPLSIARMDVEFRGTGGGGTQGIERQFLRRQGNSRVVLAGARPGQLLNVCGSTDVLALLTDRPKANERLITRAFGIGRRWMSVSTLAASGSALNWAKDQFFADTVHQMPTATITTRNTSGA